MAIGLREARPGDELAVAEVHVRSWREAYRELMPAEFLAGLDPRERAGRYEFEGGEEAPKTVVAVDERDEGRGEGTGMSPLSQQRRGSFGDIPVPFEPVLGFVTFGRSRDADAPGFGEIYALYVDPGRHGAGVGRMLMAEARGRLVDAGIEEAVLWVLQGNGRAARFYEREGWERDGATREEQPYGIVSNVARFRRTLV